MCIGFETLPKKAHNLYYALLGINFAIGNMVAPVIAYFVRDWRSYCRILGCIGFLYLPYFWLVYYKIVVVMLYDEIIANCIYAFKFILIDIVI